MYKAAGATIGTVADAWKQGMVLKIEAPSADELKLVENRSVLSMLSSRSNQESVDQLAEQKATALDLTMLLRTLSRGQAFDVLSSQANIAGYRSVLEASYALERPFAGQMTAAGRINPSKVMVVGAGVAGLAAIQQAKNMNAVVTAFDVRSAAAEQVESMGAKFLKVDFEEGNSLYITKGEIVLRSRSTIYSTSLGVLRSLVFESQQYVYHSLYTLHTHMQ